LQSVDRQLICVGLDLALWPEVKYSVLEALKLDGGRLSLDDIKDALEAQQMQLWGLHDGILRAVVITEVINYPQMRCIRFVTASGRDLEMWLDVLIDTVSQWGAEQGAHAMEFVGRKGWEKVLSKRGFGSTQIMMTKFI
jgi:hypothetical protein